MAAEDEAQRSGAGKWNAWYKDIPADAEPDTRAYSDGVGLTYWMAASFLADTMSVEDWGCGRGGFKKYYHGEYIGIDGSQTPFASKIVDLCTYRTKTESILVRHILEHNYRWKEVLESAILSFERKLCLILFTPFAETTTEIAHNRGHGVDVPDLSFAQSEIEQCLEGLNYTLFKGIETDTQYKVEHVYFIWR